jgi:predicted phage gp36 major capsid-like protein
LRVHLTTAAGFLTYSSIISAAVIAAMLMMMERELTALAISTSPFKAPVNAGAIEATGPRDTIARVWRTSSPKGEKK